MLNFQGLFIQNNWDLLNVRCLEKVSKHILPHGGEKWSKLKRKSPPRDPRHGGYSGHSPIERTNVFGGCRISSPFVGLLKVMTVVYVSLSYC